MSTGNAGRCCTAGLLTRARQSSGWQRVGQQGRAVPHGANADRQRPDTERSEQGPQIQAPVLTAATFKAGLTILSAFIQHHAFAIAARKGLVGSPMGNEMDQNGRIILSMPYNQLPNSRQPSAAISSSTASAGSDQSWCAQPKPDHAWSRGPAWRGPAMAPSGRCSVEAPDAWMRA